MITKAQVEAGARGIYLAAVSRQDLPFVPWENVSADHRQKLLQMSRDCLTAAMAGEEAPPRIRTGVRGAGSGR